MGTSQPDEPRRAVYAAITRARSHLDIATLGSCTRRTVYVTDVDNSSLLGAPWRQHEHADIATGR